MSLCEVAPRYQLNTWLADTPAAIIDAVSGVYVLPLAYSAATHATSRLDDPAGVRLGSRRLDGSRAVLEFEHAGSTFQLSYLKPAPYLLLAELRPLQLAEWGLRSWLNLLIGFEPLAANPPGTLELRATADGRVRARAAGRALAVVPERTPVYVTLHGSIQEFENDLARHGYYADGDALQPGAAPAAASVVAVRYNLEATPLVRFAVAVGADVERALARAEAGARRQAPATPPSRRAATEAAASDVDEALAAIETVLGWNSVLDLANQRWYTAPTRAWIGRKFGGWFTWLDDTFFHAHLAGTRDSEAALRNLEVALSSATPEGNLACLLSPRTRWLDRSQSPVGAYVLLSYYLRSGDAAALRRFLPILVDAFDWWRRERRDQRTGLFAFGTSRYGRGAFKGTALAARDESFMDNSPLHDGIELDPDSRQLRQLDVGLSSLLALEAELLSELARRAGDLDTAGRLASAAKEIRSSIDEHMWDAESGAYVNISPEGAPSRRIGPTSFYPLLAGVPSPERAERLVREQLLDEQGFWGRYPLPSIRRDDPAFTDNVYWRGRIWPPTTYLVYLGLRRYRFDDVARDVADRSYAMFAAEWRQHGHCHENYNAVNGEGHDSHDSDPFYGWGALLPLLRVEEAIFPSPWEGLVIVTDRGPTTSGTLWLGRTLRLETGRRAGAWRLTLDGRAVLGGDAPCRLSGLVVDERVLEVNVESRTGIALALPHVERQQVLQAALPDGASLAFDPDGAHLALGPGRSRLRLWLEPGDRRETTAG